MHKKQPDWKRCPDCGDAWIRHGSLRCTSCCAHEGSRVYYERTKKAKAELEAIKKVMAGKTDAQVSRLLAEEDSELAAALDPPRVWDEPAEGR